MACGVSRMAAFSNESKRAILEAKRVAVELVLEQEQKPFRSIPAWQRMQEHHAKIRGRYNFCVVEGDSKAGKTRWAMTATASDPRQVTQRRSKKGQSTRQWISIGNPLAKPTGRGACQ